jgi:hypothetical protein
LEERKKLEESEDKIYDFAHLSHVKKRKSFLFGKLLLVILFSRFNKSWIVTTLPPLDRGVWGKRTPDLPWKLSIFKYINSYIYNIYNGT